MQEHNIAALRSYKKQEAEIFRELDQLALLKDIAASGREPMLPLPYAGMQPDDALRHIAKATDFWNRDAQARAEFLLKLALSAPDEVRAYKLILKIWISQLSRRQSKYTKRMARKDGDGLASAARRAARPVISRLIEIRRDSQRVLRLAAEVRSITTETV